MKNISIKGIIFGWLAVRILSIIGGIAIIQIFAKNMSTEAFMALSHESGPLIFCMFFGPISIVIGGFIAAKHGEYAPYKNSLVIGVIEIILLMFFGSNYYPLWFNVFAFITAIPSALLGAYFIARINA